MIVNETIRREMTRRELLAGAAAQALPVKRKPNFLMILADDHAGYVLGCDGNPLARTPNLDRLASQGTRFRAHYCNSPVCTPSRQSFLTGQLPHAAGVTVLTTPLAADKPTLAHQFRKAGYRTAVFGKMHFNRPAEPGLHGFDTMVTENESTRAWNAEIEPKSVPAGSPAKLNPPNGGRFRTRRGSGSTEMTCRLRVMTPICAGLISGAARSVTWKRIVSSRLRCG